MKKTLALILFILPVFTIAYAVYRSTAVTVTTVENGRQVVYGAPQDGLTLGLFVLASVCVLSAVLLLIDDWKKPVREQPTTTPVSNRTATNYPV
ncbi:MAG: hypothetical protein V4676_02000 [Bacteroidota bacterium]